MRSSSLVGVVTLKMRMRKETGPVQGEPSSRLNSAISAISHLLPVCCTRFTCRHQYYLLAHFPAIVGASLIRFTCGEKLLSVQARPDLRRSQCRLLIIEGLRLYTCFSNSTEATALILESTPLPSFPYYLCCLAPTSLGRPSGSSNSRETASKPTNGKATRLSMPCNGPWWVT